MIRNELRKLLKKLSDRVPELEASMNDCSSRDVTAANLEERTAALEAAHERQDDVYSSSTQIEAVCQESREANDSEHSGRNNVKIRGLDVKKDDNWKQSVAKFCRDKLCIEGIDSADIDVAHLVLRQQNGSAEASTQKNTNRTTSLLSERTSRPRHSSATTTKRNRSDCDWRSDKSERWNI